MRLLDNMDKPVLKFDDYLNEELNLTRYDNGVCRLSERWFYYEPEDDIIYGCNEKPVDKMFAFNPVSCTIILNGDEKQYDVNNPICLIRYEFNDDGDRVTVYTDNTLKYLGEIGFNGTEITSQQSRNKIQDIFEMTDDDIKSLKIPLMGGTHYYFVYLTKIQIEK